MEKISDIQNFTKFYQSLHAKLKSSSSNSDWIFYQHYNDGLSHTIVNYLFLEIAVHAKYAKGKNYKTKGK